MTEQNPNVVWLALRHAPNLGPVGLRKKLSQLHSAQAVWQDLPLPTSQKDELISLAEKEYKLIQKQHIQILNPDHIDYPQSILRSKDNPLVVFAKGQTNILRNPIVAVVGSRKASSYGSEVTKIIVQKLVAQGCVIASGLANGIDTIAHQAALEAGGQTIAVLGYSLDMLPFQANAELINRISQAGALISQFGHQTKAQKFTFPARNRLMAALSQAVVVTQARQHSGSLLTAQAAAQYHIPVFAVPGSIFDAGSQGTHQLISNGAILAVDAADIVKTLNLTPSVLAGVDTGQGVHIPLTAPEKLLLQLLQAGPRHINQLIQDSHLTASDALAAVSLLEVKELVRPVGSGEYRPV